MQNEANLFLHLITAELQSGDFDVNWLSYRYTPSRFTKYWKLGLFNYWDKTVKRNQFSGNILNFKLKTLHTFTERVDEERMWLTRHYR